MEKATARREKRLQHRQNRKNGIKKQIIVSARSNIVNQGQFLTKKTFLKNFKMKTRMT